jgi:voltage-gated potassium channel
VAARRETPTDTVPIRLPARAVGPVFAISRRLLLAAVLTVLTARDLAPRAWIVAAVRETENIPLVRQSGADQVVVSSATAGRLLGLSTSAPELVTVVEDLLTASTGIALTVRPVEPHEIGRAPVDLAQPVAAVVRAGQLLTFAHPSVQRLQPGDKVVCVSDVDRHMDDPQMNGPDPNGAPATEQR